MDNQFAGVGRDPIEHQPKPIETRHRAEDSEPVVVSHESHQPKRSGRIKSKLKKHHKLWPPNKYTYIIMAAVVILIAGGLFLFLKLDHHMPIKKASPIVRVTPPKPSTVASSLTGLQVAPATNALPITAVMIENSVPARPQSGLGEAGVVFEAMAEGGVTRFVALYQSNASTSLGPVRSARPYFLSWMLGFNADFAHDGGSPDALADITSWGVKDINEFYNASTFQTITSRPSPHDVYTTPAELSQLEQKKGYTTSTFTSWPRKSAAPLAKPTTTTINLTLSSSDYNVSYAYDSSTNSYNRSVGGAAQTDADTNQQLSPKVVIAIVVPESNGPLDSSGAYYSDYQVVGTGQADIFQDGGLTVGQWSKSSNSSQILFTSANGQAITLDPGQVWVTAITSSQNVSSSN